MSVEHENSLVAEAPVKLIGEGCHLLSQSGLGSGIGTVSWLDDSGTSVHVGFVDGTELRATGEMRGSRSLA